MIFSLHDVADSYVQPSDRQRLLLLGLRLRWWCLLLRFLLRGLLGVLCGLLCGRFCGSGGIRICAVGLPFTFCRGRLHQLLALCDGFRSHVTVEFHNGEVPVRLAEVLYKVKPSPRIGQRHSLFVGPPRIRHLLVQLLVNGHISHRELLAGQKHPQSQGFVHLREQCVGIVARRVQPPLHLGIYLCLCRCHLSSVNRFPFRSLARRGLTVADQDGRTPALSLPVST
mmetsp:Transcript_9696/g.29475  ORF Transcript_9696/g.29475 Transcript_9696/m.29475 type:complete len:226 (+) Transcript_9696:1373-2050(+)